MLVVCWGCSVLPLVSPCSGGCLLTVPPVFSKVSSATLASLRLRSYAAWVVAGGSCLGGLLGNGVGSNLLTLALCSSSAPSGRWLSCCCRPSARLPIPSGGPICPVLCSGLLWWTSLAAALGELSCKRLLRNSSVTGEGSVVGAGPCHLAGPSSEFGACSPGSPGPFTDLPGSSCERGLPTALPLPMSGSCPEGPPGDSHFLWHRGHAHDGLSHPPQTCKPLSH